jgi:hypothetical protein
VPYLPSKPDFLLDRKLAQVTTNRLITDSQIDALVAICNPPSDALRDNIAVEFERAALVLRSCRSVAGGRAKRKAFQGQLSKAQSYAKRLSNILTKLDPDLKLGLNDKFETAQNGKENSVTLFEVQYLLDVFEDIDLLYPPGMKSEDVLVWVIDGLIHAIETRLAPAFNCYSPPKRGGWFSTARRAKLIFTFLKTVEPEKCQRYNLDCISYRIKRTKLRIMIHEDRNDRLRPDLAISAAPKIGTTKS